jgi:hypothetical protein
VAALGARRGREERARRLAPASQPTFRAPRGDRLRRLRLRLRTIRGVLRVALRGVLRGVALVARALLQRPRADLRRRRRREARGGNADAERERLAEEDNLRECRDDRCDRLQEWAREAGLDEVRVCVASLG